MEHKLLVFLLQNAFEVQKVSYTNLYLTFNVNFSSQKEVDTFHSSLEKVERKIIKDLLYNKQLPLYSVLLYKEEDNLPDLCFFDMFALLNKDEYKQIAGNMIPSDACKYTDIKYQIYELGLEFLVQDLNKRFPNKEALLSFIEEVSPTK